MPYGPVSKGGPTADARMERCVADLKAKGHDEQSAIAICKASIARSMRVDAVKNAGRRK